MLASTSFIPFSNLLTQPWHWAFSGAMIALLVFLLNWMGKSFGLSSSFKTICAAMGAGKHTPFFDIDIKSDAWRMIFVAGALVGGAIAVTWMQSPEPVAISDSTISYLHSIGLSYPEADASGKGFIPTSLFDFMSFKGVILALIGGFLVGFGARYGNGCTSGHGITGLAHLQLPSLLTVAGFFIGGLIMAHLFLPFLVAL